MVRRQETLRLLDELEPLGFDDDAFSTLHHFDKETIASHRAYCKKGETFSLQKPSNIIVQQRLRFVAEACRALGGRPLKSETFFRLAKIASDEIHEIG